MATTVGDLFVKLGVDATALNQGFSAAEKRLEKFGTQLFFLGSRTTAGVTLPITAAIGVISKYGLEFDKAMSESLAIMKQSSPQIRAELEKTAVAISETTKFSSTQAAEGYYHLISAGIQASDVLKGALPIAARFAQAGMMDMAKSTEFLAGAQASLATGIESNSQKVEQMGKIADVLTEANNRALGTIEDFANALTNRAGAALRQTNKSVEEGVAVLAAFAEQNIKGKIAGQQLWMVIRDLGTYALKNADAFKKHNIAVYDSNGAMRNMADIIGDVEKATSHLSDAQKAQMFMELGIPLRSVAATKALLGYSDAIRAHEVALRAAGGATKIVADNQMLALQNRMDQLAHQFQNAAIDIFKGFVPTIENYVIPAVKGLLVAFQNAGHLLAGLPEPIKAIGLAFVGVVIAIGPLVTIMGSMTLLTGSALQGFKALTGVIGIFGTTMGIAAGGSTAAVNALSGMAIAAQGAASVLGTVGSTAQVVVLNQVQLNAAMNAAGAAAMAGAKAMGYNAVAVADFGLEAKIAVANMNRMAVGQAAVNDAMAAATGSTGLAARAFAFLLNPITLIVGGLALAGGAWYLYKKNQDAALQTVVDNSDAFRAQTDNLQTNLDTFERLHGKLLLNTDQSGKLAAVTDALSKSVGLSSEAFTSEADQSDAVTNSIRAQITARKELMAEAVRQLTQKEIETKANVEAIQRQLDAVNSGKAVDYRVGSGGQVFAQPFNTSERLTQIGSLTKALGEAEDAAKKAHSALLNLTGMSSPKWTFPTMTVSDMNAWAKMAKTTNFTLPSTDYMKQWGEKMKKDFLSTKPSEKDIANFEEAWKRMMNPFYEKPAVVGEAPSIADKNSPAVKLKSQIDEMKSTLQGGGGKDLKVLLESWHQLMSETGGKIAQDPTAVDNLWQAYSKLRGELSKTVPEFERMFGEQLKQAAITDDIKNNFNEYVNTWSPGMMKIVEDIGKVSVAMEGFSKGDLDRFFKENEGTIKDLIPFYNKLDPAVKVMIDRYQAWATVTDKATAALDENATKALSAISDYGDAAAAKMSDTQDQLSLFSAKYAAREIVALRKGLATQNFEADKGFKKQLQNLSQFADVKYKTEVTTGLKILNQAKADNAARLKNEELLGLLRIAQAAGVGDKLIRDEKHTADERIKIISEAIVKQNILNRRVEDSKNLLNSLSNIGSIAKSLGFTAAGDGIGKLSSGLTQLTSGLALAGKQGASAADKMNGYVAAAAGAIDTWTQVQQMGSGAARAASLAITGAQIGFMFGGPAGAGVGAAVGAIASMFVGDPRWKDIQRVVAHNTGTNISDGVAKGLEQAAKNIKVDRSRLMDELAHGTAAGLPAMTDKSIANYKAYYQQLASVIGDTGGMNAGNFADWTSTIKNGFTLFKMGVLDANDLSMTLDQTWESIVATGTKTSGVLSANATQLIKLAREAGVASKAMKAYVDAQLGVAAGGFNKLTQGLFGVGIQSEDDAVASEEAQVKLNEKIMKLKAQIADYETKGTNNEKQKVALLLARVHLTAAERNLTQEQAKQTAGENVVKTMSGPNGQAEFDRMARLGALTASSMQSEGKSLFDILDALGPALDTMIVAQETFGFATNDSFNQLMKFRDFATVHPELVNQIQGLTDLTLGLNNSAYLTQQGFQDLASQAADTMQKAQDAGLTQDETYSAMHKTLQTLWEVQRDNNFQLDEATQKMLDEAEAAGTVGKKYMSSNDLMVEGIGRLNQLFETLLKHLGIDIPDTADQAAKKLKDAFDATNPKVTVDVSYKYDEFVPNQQKPDPGTNPNPQPPERQTLGDGSDPVSLHDTGVGMVTRPHLAMVHTNEAIVPLSQLWQQMDQRYREQQTGGGNGAPPPQTVIQPGGVQVSVTAPYYMHEQDYIAKRITTGVLEAIGGNDEPGLRTAMTQIISDVVSKMGAK